MRGNYFAENRNFNKLLTILNRFLALKAME